MFDALDLVNQGLAGQDNIFTPGPNSDPALTETKKQRALGIRAICSEKIESGFISSALGSRTIYPSDAASQLNIAAAARHGGWLWCQGSDGPWSIVHHTIVQAMQVYADMTAHIQMQQVRHAERLRAIMAANDVTAVNAVVW